MAIHFGLLALTSLLIFLHPYVTYPLSLLLFRRQQVTPDPRAPLPTATLMFSARNEERALPAKLANLRDIKALNPGLHCIAYCDASTDGTLALLSACPDLEVIAGHGRTGKAVAMARMVARADTDICIFTDANVILEPAGVERMLRYFTDPTVGGVAGSLCYNNGRASATAFVGSLYWRVEEWIKRLESRCGSMMGADGSIFATRRLGYPVVPAHLLDDLTVSMSVVLEGKRLIIADDVRATERSATVAAEESRRKQRIACRAYNTHRHLWPQIVARLGAADIYKYLSHKFLRWLGVVPLTVCVAATAAMLVAAHSWMLLLLAIAAGGAVLALGRLAIFPFGAVLAILESIVATFRGLVDARSGATYQVWDPAQSRN